MLLHRAGLSFRPVSEKMKYDILDRFLIPQSACTKKMKYGSYSIFLFSLHTVGEKPVATLSFFVFCLTRNEEYEKWTVAHFIFSRPY